MFPCFLSASPDLFLLHLSIQLVFNQSPLAGCLLVGFPFLIAGVLCYICCRVRSAMSDNDSAEGTPLQRRKKLTEKKSD